MDLNGSISKETLKTGCGVNNRQFGAEEVSKEAYWMGLRYFDRVCSKIMGVLVGNIRPSKIRLLHCYIVHWIHVNWHDLYFYSCSSQANFCKFAPTLIRLMLRKLLNSFFITHFFILFGIALQDFLFWVILFSPCLEANSNDKVSYFYLSW